MIMVLRFHAWRVRAAMSRTRAVRAPGAVTLVAGGGTLHEQPHPLDEGAVGRDCSLGGRWIGTRRAGAAGSHLEPREGETLAGHSASDGPGSQRADRVRGSEGGAGGSDCAVRPDPGKVGGR